MDVWVKDGDVFIVLDGTRITLSWKEARELRDRLTGALRQWAGGLQGQAPGEE